MAVLLVLYKNSTMSVSSVSFPIPGRMGTQQGVLSSHLGQRNTYPQS